MVRVQGAAAGAAFEQSLDAATGADEEQQLLR